MRGKMKWDPAYNIGVDVIDNQHKVLFDLANDLNGAYAMGSGRQVVDTLFGIIMNYSFMHFETEESYIEDQQDFLQHCYEHYRLLRELQNFAVEFRNSRSREIDPGVFLEKWLLHHITNYDRPFLLKDPQKHVSSDEITGFEEFEQEEIERRRHKRIRYDLVLDEDILGHLYNANTLKSGSATVVDLSAGGLKIYTDLEINLEDLLIISCRVGKSFTMKEKVTATHGKDNFYGVKFISPDEETIRFLTELCGAVQKYRHR